MSAFIKKGFLKSIGLPLITTKRFRGKINIQRPQKLFYERARMVAATNPILPPVPINKNCFKVSETKQKPHNPYNDIIAKDILNWLNHSKMVAIFHLNSIKQQEIFKTRVALHKQQMYYKIYGKALIKQAVEGTQYEAIVPLFEAYHCIIFSPEAKVAKLLKIVKKVHQMILIAGILENRLLSRNEFIECAKLPDLQTARGQLVALMNSAAGQIVNNLEGHQKQFVNILDVHAKGEAKSNKNEDEQTEKSVEDESQSKLETETPKVE